MAKTLQKFWALTGVTICYGLAMTVLVMGGPEGCEQVLRWAFSLVNLTFIAIFLVGLQLGLNAHAAASQEQDT